MRHDGPGTVLLTWTGLPMCALLDIWIHQRKKKGSVRVSLELVMHASNRSLLEREEGGQEAYRLSSAVLGTGENGFVVLPYQMFFQGMRLILSQFSCSSS